MYSKNAEPPPRRQRFQTSRLRWSLTLWFTVFNSFAAFSVLALIAILLYLGLSSQLGNQNHLYLHDELSILHNMIRSEGVGDALASEADSDQHGQEYVKHYIRIIDRGGQVLLETPGMTEAAPHRQFSAPLRDGRPGIDRTWRNASGNLVLGAAEWVTLNHDSGEQGVLEVALDVTNVQFILEGYRAKIYVTLFVGLLLCLLASRLIALRGTRPLQEIATMFSRVSVANLDERVEDVNWPTEIRVLAHATNRMLDRLSDSFARLNTSARNLSHKMRTPLTIMKGEAEVALSRERSVEELQQVILSGLEENSRLVRLIDNILFLSNVEQGKTECRKDLLSAVSEIEKVLQYYGPLAEDRNIEIRCHGDVRINADSSLLRKLTAALISNAITYNAPNGSIDLHLCLAEGDCGVITVSDTGCGIAPGEISRCFDLFYRIYATRYMDPHGTGLGLPIARAIMNLHKGEITVTSQPGRGTTVTLKFPAP